MPKAARIRWSQVSAVCCVLFAVTAAVRGQDRPAESPRNLVRAAVANEVAAANAASAKHMFRDRKQTPRGTQTRLYVETTQAMAGMAVAINDQPLDPAQKQAETDHLTALVNNPEQLRRKRAREHEDAERTLLIVKALPDAFTYEYADVNNDGDRFVRMNFVPNPQYNPPSHVEQVLTGMRGYLLIDTKRKRLAKIDGTLFRDVTFGWGFLGHLDQGGHFLVQQGEVEGGGWDLTRMTLNFTGKILLVKNLNIASDEVFSDYRPVPGNLTFAQGVEVLKAEQEKLAHNIRADDRIANKNSR